MLGKIEGRRRSGQQRMRWLDGITNSMDMNLSKFQEIVKERSLACCRPWGHRIRHDFVTEQQQFCFYLHVLRRYGGGREVQEEGDICKPMADSC